jgi:hypothetical protein
MEYYWKQIYIYMNFFSKTDNSSLQEIPNFANGINIFIELQI